MSEGSMPVLDGDDPLGEGTPSATDTVSADVWCESGSARATIGSAIRSSVEQLETELPRARLGEDPEGVHQARVATRRLRSDLRTFGPMLDAEWREATRAELKRLADALGAVRDLDVLAMRLTAAFDEVDVAPAGGEALLAAVHDQTCAARRALLDVLDDERTAGLLAELRRRADDPPTIPSAVGRAELRLRPLVRRPWRKLVRTVDGLGDEPEVSELHRIRLLAKRARYAAEAVTPVYRRKARRLARSIKDVQDVLGDMNDAEVAAAWLGHTAETLDAHGAFAAGQLAHHFRGVADAHRHGWERSFDRARTRSTWLT